MKEIPRIIDGAKVIMSTPLDERHHQTGNCKQTVDGVLMGPAASLAICKYEDEAGFYLFCCDQNWNTVTDSFHLSVDEAKAQAEFEYEGVSSTWQQR